MRNLCLLAISLLALTLFPNHSLDLAGAISAGWCGLCVRGWIRENPVEANNIYNGLVAIGSIAIPVWAIV